MRLKTMDDKLKDLIRICKKTKNYKKLAVVGIILLSNRANEIEVNLGLRPRKREEGETLHHYCGLVNSTLENNFSISLFSPSFMKALKTTEHIFLKTRGDLQLTHIIEIYDLYYQVRGIKIPDLSKIFSSPDLVNTLPEVGFMCSLRSSHESGHNENMINKIMAFRVSQKEHELTAQLNEHYDPELFERRILLSQVKQSLSKHQGGKLTIQGTLKDNTVYQRSVEDTIGYILLGIFILACMLGIALLFEMVAYPGLSTSLGMFLFVVLGLGGLIFFIYWKEFMR